MSEIDSKINPESSLANTVWLSDGALPAPRLTERIGHWYQFVIAIGNDEVAYITMTDSALRDLCDRQGMNYNYVSRGKWK